MNNIINNSSNKELDTNENYKILLKEIKSKLQKSQLRAILVVNVELIRFYWEVGNLIIKQQEKSKWGDKLFYLVI